MQTIITTVGTSLLGNARRELKKDKLNDDEISNYVRHAKAEKASVETNSLSRLIQGDNKIIFLHSQTDEGKRCAKILANHYNKDRSIRAKL